MKIQPVIDRALQDPTFAAELASKAGKAAKEADERGAERRVGDAQYELLAMFAGSPDDLARMASLVVEGEDGATTTLTTTTITTTTSLPCGITTTTTTTTTLTGTFVVEADAEDAGE